MGRPRSVEETRTLLRARFGDRVEVTDSFGHSLVTAPADAYRDLAAFLRDEPDLACDFCDFTTGVDRGEDGFEVVTSLYSTQHRHNVRVKVAVPRDEPVVASLAEVFPACDWHERETMEMFGIRFEGHPRPVKLLLAEPFEGYPLRKDFPLMSREVKPWPGAVEGEEEEEE